ncbi:hypothetical protein [Tardiphaga sp.]|uniref:hypothetical protein n=1 Tax=Tardiphaga sp. TaxID=1926292 RepID=UPI00262000E0|nr:hypothetical protein [Tardiphaga sp.]MDB5616177.1 hypothetical protein [Tardiphaga sp.]
MSGVDYMKIKMPNGKLLGDCSVPEAKKQLKLIEQMTIKDALAAGFMTHSDAHAILRSVTDANGVAE